MCSFALCSIVKVAGSSRCWHFHPACPHPALVLNICMFHDLFQPLVLDILTCWYPLLSSTTALRSDVLLVLPPLCTWKMVPLMVDRLWRDVSMVFLGRVNISFTHTCTIKISSSDIVFQGSLGHLSGPGALPGFRQHSTYFAISWLVSAPRNLARDIWATLAPRWQRGRRIASAFTSSGLLAFYSAAETLLIASCLFWLANWLLV